MSTIKVLLVMTLLPRVMTRRTKSGGLRVENGLDNSEPILFKDLSGRENTLSDSELWGRTPRDRYG